MTTTTKKQTTTITTKYLKEAQYESKLFKVVEYNNTHKILKRFVKNWEEAHFVYLKNKYLDKNHDTLEEGNYYKMKLTFDCFTNDEGKDIVYICKIRYKPVEYQEKVVMNESDDSDF